MPDPNDIKSIFLIAVERPVPERAVYLDEATAGDAALRARVEALLQAHDDPDSFLARPVAEFGATVDLTRRDSKPINLAGTMIGPYKLLEQIGEGGMGVVYMADQQSPVRRRVALKVIKAGMDTRQVIARFEAERQALALMDHSNIARVFDAGSTDTGRPYFVMELVRGIPITEYCDQGNLPIHERLELFVQVCQAVQHAHQKGIIHRDIKPSNVLVTVNDGRAVPKVIDFGVAKATNQQLTEKTLFTAFAAMVGTPLYMSPEQAEMSSLDVDTRSDIYSLGVLLYELLTGTTPFDQKRLRSAAYAEMVRIIREEEPPKPSTRISTLGDAQTATGARRKIDGHRLGQLLKGDLDWIVMKALEKDRTRRYETANDFAADVVRHLSDQPVDACPPSAAYRVRKFVRRNRLKVAAAALVIASLVAGIGASTFGLVRATRAEKLISEQKDAVTSERDRAIRAEAAAQVQRTKAELEGRRAQTQYAESLINHGDALTTTGEFRAAYDRYDKAAVELHKLGGSLGRLDLSLSRIYRASPPPLWTAAIPGGNNLAWAVVTGRNEIIAACEDGSFRIFDLLTGELLRSFGGADKVTRIASAVGKDGPVVIVGALNFARVISPVDGAILRHADDDRMMRFCALSDDGSLAASVDQAGAVIFWETATLKRIGEGRHGLVVAAAAFSHDGKLVATVSTDDFVMLWDPRTATETRRFAELHESGYPPGSTQVAFTLDDQTIVCAETAGFLGAFQLDGKKLGRWPAHDGVIKSLIPAPDGNQLITSGIDGNVHVYNNFEPSQTMVNPKAAAINVTYVGGAGLKPCAAAIGPEAKTQGVVVGADTDGTMYAWPVSPVGDTDRIIAGLTFSPEGLLLAGTRTDNGTDPDLKSLNESAGLGRDIRDSEVRDVATGRILRRSRHDGWSGAHALSSDGRFLYVVVAPNSVEAFDLATGACIWSTNATGNGSRPNAMCLSSDGAILATGGREDSARVWDAKTGALLRSLPGNSGYVGTLAFAPTNPARPIGGASSLQGRHLLVGSGSFGVVSDWDLGSSARPRRVNLPGRINSITFSPDQRLIAIATNAHSISLLDAATLKITGTLGPMPSDIPNMAFINAGDEPGKWGVSSGAHGIRAWNLLTREEGMLLSKNFLHFSINGLAASPDGSIIAGGAAGQINLKLPRQYRTLAQDKPRIAMAAWDAEWGLWAWTRELLARERAAGHDVPALLEARANWACGDMDVARRAFDAAVSRHEVPAWYAKLCMSVSDTPLMLSERAALPFPKDANSTAITDVALPEGVIPAADVKALQALIGQEAAAEGTVVNCHWSKSGSVLVIAFAGDEGHRSGLQAAVFKGRREVFDAAFNGDAAGAFAGARLRVQGKLIRYAGYVQNLKDWPEIVLDDPSQVTIVSDSPASK